MKIYRVIASVLLSAFASTQVVAGPGDNVLPADVVKPCERHVEVDKITRITVPMVPFRGVNLIFPFELDNSKTVYSLSSSNTWNYNKADGSNLVAIHFSQFSNQWGELADFTIKHGEYLFSITLQADPNLKNHCTNIVFDFSEKQLKEMREKKKEEYLAKLKKKYERKMEQLDQEAESRALKLVGALAQTEADYSNIHTYETVELDNGDEIELYVTEMQDWGEFTVVKAEVSNFSGVNPLYLQDLEVGQLEDNGGKRQLTGAIDMDQKLSPDGSGEITFTTQGDVPYTGAYATLKTNRGQVEVEW